MPYSADVYNVLIASPSDVAEERQLVRQDIYSWNELHSRDLGIVLHPVSWETHIAPQLGDRPQGIINRELVDISDALVGIFWTKLGSPTGVEDSGTVEEIKLCVSQGKQVMVYFSSKPVIMDTVDPKQYKKLKAFKAYCQKEGIIAAFESTADLRNQLRKDLLMMARRLKGPATGQAISTEQLIASTVGRELQMVRTQYELLLRRFENAWTVERDSDPYSTDDGKNILQQADRNLLELRSQPVISDYPQLADALGELQQQLRALQRHQTYLDGGVSFQAFWTAGDEALTRAKEIGQLLDGLLRKPPSDSTGR